MTTITRPRRLPCTIEDLERVHGKQWQKLEATCRKFEIIDDSEKIAVWWMIQFAIMWGYKNFVGCDVDRLVEMVTFYKES